MEGCFIGARCTIIYEPSVLGSVKNAFVTHSQVSLSVQEPDTNCTACKRQLSSADQLPLQVTCDPFNEPHISNMYTVKGQILNTKNSHITIDYY
jgi:hypothetical protein